MWRTDVAVVGAGPAGMAAAVAAADVGASVTVIDEYAGAGGQFFKRANPTFAPAPQQLSREHEAGELLRAALGHERITTWTSALVWGAFPDDTLAILRDGRSELLQFKALVIATGALRPARGVSGLDAAGRGVGGRRPDACKDPVGEAGAADAARRRRAVPAAGRAATYPLRRRDRGDPGGDAAGRVASATPQHSGGSGHGLPKHSSTGTA